MVITRTPRSLSVFLGPQRPGSGQRSSLPPTPPTPDVHFIDDPPATALPPPRDPPSQAPIATAQNKHSTTSKVSSMPSIPTTTSSQTMSPVTNTRHHGLSTCPRPQEGQLPGPSDSTPLHHPRYPSLSLFQQSDRLYAPSPRNPNNHLTRHLETAPLPVPKMNAGDPLSPTNSLRMMTSRLEGRNNPFTRPYHEDVTFPSEHRRALSLASAPRPLTDHGQRLHALAFSLPASPFSSHPIGRDETLEINKGISTTALLNHLRGDTLPLGPRRTTMPPNHNNNPSNMYTENKKTGYVSEPSSAVKCSMTTYSPSTDLEIEKKRYPLHTFPRNLLNTPIRMQSEYSYYSDDTNATNGQEGGPFSRFRRCCSESSVDIYSVLLQCIVWGALICIVLSGFGVLIAYLVKNDLSEAMSPNMNRENILDRDLIVLHRQQEPQQQRRGYPLSGEEVSNSQPPRRSDERTFDGLALPIWAQAPSPPSRLYLRGSNGESMDYWSTINTNQNGQRSSPFRPNEYPS